MCSPPQVYSPSSYFNLMLINIIYFFTPFIVCSFLFEELFALIFQLMESFFRSITFLLFNTSSEFLISMTVSKSTITNWLFIYFVFLLYLAHSFPIFLKGDSHFIFILSSIVLLMFHLLKFCLVVSGQPISYFLLIMLSQREG